MIRVAAVGLLGIALGFLLAQVTAASPRPAVAVAAAPVAAPVVRCVATLSPADLAAIKGELVTAVIAGRAQPAAAPEAPPPPPSAEAVATAARASSIVDAALAIGEWTADDARELRELAPALTPDEGTRLRSAIVMAINDQRLRPTTPELF